MTHLRIVLVVIFIYFYQQGFSQVINIESDLIHTKGLYFEGVNYNPDNPSGAVPSVTNFAYRFGKRIAPHGTSSIDVVGDYIYVAWYKGGMENRYVMLSRRLISGGNWVSMQIPHQHIGFRGDTYIGDSHNYVAVKISPIDNTIHMVYDLHSYEQDQYGLGDDYFNYSISISGGAIVADANWNNTYLFRNQANNDFKRNYLNTTENYEDGTYPEFVRLASGALFYNMRYGGSGNGDHTYSIYDSNGWSTQTNFNKGKQTDNDDKYSLYGGFKFLNGQLRAGFSIRYKNRLNFTPAYKSNSGLYYAHANLDTNSYNWYDHQEYTPLDTNNKVTLPIQNISNLDFVAASDYMQHNDNITTNPVWTVSKNDAIHFMTTINRDDAQGANTKIYGHYYKTKNSSTVTKILDSGLGYDGDLVSYKGNIYMVGLNNNRIKISRTADDQSNWSTVYDESIDTSNKTYRHGNVHIKDDKIYYFLMEVGSGDAQPIYLSVFDIVDDITIEAEDYDDNGYSDFDSGNNGGVYRTDDVDIDSFTTASNGYAITDFKGNDWMEYTFYVDEGGDYKVYLTASNTQKTGSLTSFTLDGNTIANFPVQITGDWNVFKENEIPQEINLTTGTHTCRIKQSSSLSSKPDKIRFEYQGATTSSSKKGFSKQQTKEVNKLNIYPNPAKNSITIDGAELHATYQISNANGKLLQKGTIEEESQLIDTSHLASGIYFLRIGTTHKMIVKKIILL
tara:strand:+ start:26213 stop:28408 length:2196 start_codon:yes stop_codon:yes gene_type:complete